MKAARLALFLGLLCAASAAWAAVQPAVEFLGLPPVAGPLANPPERQPMPSGDWQPVQLPHVVAKRSLGYTAAQVQTSFFRVAVPPSEQPLFLYLPRWQTVGQLAVYGDGRLLWRSTGDPLWNGFNTPLWLALDPLDGQPRPQQLLLRLDGVEGLGGGISSLWLGSEGELLPSYRLRHVLQVALPAATGAAVLALGLFALGVWSQRRHEVIYGLFFIASVLYCLRILHYLGPLDTGLVGADWFGWITVNSIGWLVAITQVFILRLCRKPMRWLERGLVGCMLAATLLTLPFWQSAEHIGSLASASYLGGGVMYLFSIPLVIVAAHRSDSLLARWLAWSGLLGLAVGSHDWLLQNYLLSLDALYLAPYWQIAFCTLFGIVLGQRYLASIRGLERSHEELALRLAAREAELQRSHEQLREIERREVLAQERQRLLQDMHDGLGSSLTGALRMAQRGSDASDLEQALRECMDELKLTIDSIVPMDADLALLLATLRFRLQPRLEAGGMRLRWQVGELPRLAWLTPGNVLHVLRILQEVVANILKHAGAGEILVRTQLEPGGIRVQVLDDGSGFVPAEGAAGHGHGIGNIRSRAKALGGWVAWSAGEGRPGSEFTLWLPLELQAVPG
ncbi:sensor histidine kinase [Pseudomonas solani]|uniref:sensor histidine kinase n=1 Tax=Pseudomonas solani TaxID=2731552 RepID=UPI003C2EDBA1